MPKEVVVKVDIELDRVRLKVRRAVFNKNMFKVRAGDTIRWELRWKGGDGPGLQKLRPRVKFLSFPLKERLGSQALLDQGNTCDASAGVVEATVSRDAPGGPYGYLCDVLVGGKRVELHCFWRPDGRHRQPIAMVGTVKDPPPH